MAKQLTMAFSPRELEALQDAYCGALLQRKPNPKDPDLVLDVDLALRLEVATFANGAPTFGSVLEIPWVLPVIRKALQASSRIHDLERSLKEAQAEVKRLHKPAPKPKPRPKQRKPATVPVDARTAARSGAAPAAATGSAKGTSGPPAPAAAAAGGPLLPVRAPTPAAS